MLINICATEMLTGKRKKEKGTVFSRTPQGSPALPHVVRYSYPPDAVSVIKN